MPLPAPIKTILFDALTSWLAIAFFGLSCLCMLDYFLPDNSQKLPVTNIILNRERGRRTTSKSYALQIEKYYVRVNLKSYNFVQMKDSALVKSSKILHIPKEIIVRDKSIDFYASPFTYFPLFPIIFFLPYLLWKFKNESIFNMAARTFSLAIAVIGLIMMLF